METVTQQQVDDYARDWDHLAFMSCDVEFDIALEGWPVGHGGETAASSQQGKFGSRHRDQQVANDKEADMVINFEGTVLPWLLDDMPPVQQQHSATVEISLQEAINESQRHANEMANDACGSCHEDSLTTTSAAICEIDPLSMVEDILAECMVVQQQASLDSNILSLMKDSRFNELIKKANCSAEFGKPHASVKTASAASPASWQSKSVSPPEPPQPPAPPPCTYEVLTKFNTSVATIERVRWSGKPVQPQRLSEKHLHPAAPSHMLATNLKVHNKQQQKRTLRLLAVARYKQKKLDA